MLRNFINSASSQLGRRFRAFLTALLLPLVIMFSIVIGTAETLWEGIKAYFSDLKYLITVEVPTAWRKLILIIRFGGTYNA